MSGLFLGEIICFFLNGRTSWQIASVLMMSVLLAVYFVRFVHYSYRITAMLCGIFLFLIGFGYMNTKEYVKKLSDAEYHCKTHTLCRVSGRIYDVREKENSIYCYIDHVSLYDKAYVSEQISEKLTYENILNEDDGYKGTQVNENESDKEISTDKKNTHDGMDRETKGYQYNKVLLVIKKESRDNSRQKLIAGCTILADAEFSEYSRARNEGGFDEKNYYQSLGICLKLNVTDYQLKTCSGMENRLLNKMFRLKEHLRERIGSLSDIKYAQLYMGILLGDKAGVSEEVSELYKMTGISHILTISGLHISLIGYFIYKLARRFWGMFFSTAVALTAMYLYAIMTGNTFSTKRAFIMFAINIVAQLIGRSYDLISALSVAFLVLIIDNPLCIQNTGVCLSFGAVIGVGVVYAVADEYIQAETKLIRSLMISMCINMVTRPVIINACNIVPMYSSVINLLVIAAMSFVVAFGMIGVFVSYIWFDAGRCIFGLGCTILKLYERLCKVFIRLPHAVKITADVKAVKIIVYYAIIVIVMSVINNINAEKRRTKKKALSENERNTGKKAISFIQFLGLCIFLFMLITHHSDRGLTIKMLDVGQGDCIFICSDGMTMLVDAGSSSKKDIEKYTIYPFLKANGVERLDYLLLTHSDYDHISGAADLMREKVNGKSYVRNLILQDIDESVRDEAYTDLVNEALKNGINIIYFSRGQAISRGKTDIICLWPLKEAEGMDKNTLSIVFELRRNAKNKNSDFHMLFTGDLSQQGEQCLADMRDIELETTDILKTAHHGSNGSTCEEFLDIISPRAAIISCGINNRYGHPGQETLARLQNIGSDIYTTQVCGQISIFFRKNSFYIEPFVR